MDRALAFDRVETLLNTVDEEEMPVPVREVWVYGDVALGLDPVDRLDVYCTKDILMRGDSEAAERFETELGVKGVGQTVRAEWAEQFPEYVRANDNGHAAPEKCLAAHLIADDEPIHLEVCNASFGDNVTQRLRGAMARDAYEQILDPRGVCLWVDGQRDEEAMAKLRAGDLPFPTLSASLEMLGLGAEEATEAATAMREFRAEQTGATVRGDVV
jgi:hypothetical protein